MKNWKKVLAVVAASAMTMLAVAACGGAPAAAPAAAPAPAAEAEAPAEEAAEEEAPAAAPTEAAYMATMSSPMTGVIAEKATELCAKLPEITGGAIGGNFIGNNALGAQRDVVNMLAAGEVEMICEGSIPTDMFAPEYNFLVAPYMFRSSQHLLNVVNSPLYEAYNAKLEESGITILGTFIRGPRETISTQELDWSNPSSIIIRMPDVAAYITAWKDGIGANTQVMGGNEVYSALQNGVVNACEGPWEQHYSQKQFEVAKYMYQTEHVQEFYCIYASKIWFDGLDPEVQTALKSGIEEWCEGMTDFMLSEVERNKELLITEGGMEEKEVDKEALFDAVAPVWEAKFAAGEWASTMEEVMSYYDGE